MPLIEGVCRSEQCPAGRAGYRQEHFYHHIDAILNGCDFCGRPTERVMSTFNVVFTGVISARYNDRNLEGAHLEGHTAWERDPITKKPRAVEIKTWDDQRAFCARNNCALPSEMPKNMVVKEDGKSLENTRGMPGTEL